MLLNVSINLQFDTQINSQSGRTMSKSNNQAGHEPAFAPAATNALDITFGHATVKYCTSSFCWVLPAGPRQTARLVRTEQEAQAFAMQMNELIEAQLGRFPRGHLMSLSRGK